MPIQDVTSGCIPIDERAVAAVMVLLTSERLMSLGVNRPDGWPQVTTLGYVNEGLNLYFVTARDSQKLANIQADPRVSVAIRSEGAADGSVGLSLAGRAEEVTVAEDIEHLNQLVFSRYPGVSVYCPSGDSVALIRIKPEIISAVSVSQGRSRSECFSVGAAGQGGGAASPTPAASIGRRVR